MKAWFTNSIISKSDWFSKRCGTAACIVLVTLTVGSSSLSAQATMISQPSFDHSLFDSLLHRYVANGMVDYDRFKHTPQFSAYLHRLARFDPSTLPETERLAFWINAYNAYTIELINEHDERASVRDINKTFGFLKLHGPWSEPLATVGGHHYTLDDIEQRIIRPMFHEPRVHFALVCAAMGCPPLRSEAYTGATLSAQLDDQARIFLLESPAKNRVDVPGRKVYVSMIFNLYKDDFGGTDAAVGRFIARFYPSGPARELLDSGDFKLTETPYDWTLNSQANAARHR
ncbi:MAG: DUF547 domain-containing protein [Gemmatimonadaceae bacterium]